ncbi:MAG: S-layer homology domain-containing protein [Phormidesmis sp.]
MTQSPLEPPNEPRPPEPPTGPSRPLTFEEMVAIVAAFLTLGSLLFFGLGRGRTDSFESVIVGTGRSTTVPEVTEPEERSQPFIFGDGTDSVAADLPGTDGEAPLSARERLALRAARRRDVAAARPGLFDRVRAGAAGTAAGVALAPDGVEAEETPPVVEPSPTPTPTQTSGVAPSAAATSTPESPINFEDVPDDYWAKPYIDALSSRGLTSGFEDGLFRPEQPVTRAQIANIVSRAFDLTADKEDLVFSDVSDDYWAREPIEEIVQGGFMKGFPDDTFAPDEPVTHTQALTTMVTGLEISAPSDEQAVLSRYTDASAIPQWATGKIAAATSASLVVNHPNVDQLNPAQPTTRAELAAIIYQALVSQGAVEPIESEYVVNP